MGKKRNRDELPSGIREFLRKDDGSEGVGQEEVGQEGVGQEDKNKKSKDLDPFDALVRVIDACRKFPRAHFLFGCRFFSDPDALPVIFSYPPDPAMTLGLLNLLRLKVEEQIIMNGERDDDDDDDEPPDGNKTPNNDDDNQNPDEGDAPDDSLD